ncbi:MAG: hypothetical protein ACJ75C_13240 [Actinomycetes bacterium]
MSAPRCWTSWTACWPPGASRSGFALLDELDQRARPQVVVVEDAHWADEATLQHRVQLLAGDLASSALVRRLRLAPLSRRGWRCWPARLLRCCR